jgi:glutathione S-transferase
MFMKLYYSPGACSLATHIALLEGGLEFDLERVDLKSKLTETGADFTTINTKGYVPALVLDSRDVVTENVAVLDWIAGEAPHLGLPGPLGRTQLLQALAYISSEIHKSFKPFFAGAGEEDLARAQKYIHKRLRWLADRKVGRYLFGNEPSVADFYLFVMLRWASRIGIAIPDGLVSLQMRMLDRPRVQSAIEFEEGPAKKTANL